MNDSIVAPERAVPKALTPKAAAGYPVGTRSAGSADQPSQARKVVDWAAVEPLYRSGHVSLSQLAAHFGISRAAIHKHADKHGWARETLAKQEAIDARAAILNEVAFNRGRDLCIALLQDADAGNHATAAEAQRNCRDGHAQDRFAQRYLAQLIQDPAALDGFAAVLSARLGASDVLPASHFDLPMAEYEAGDVHSDAAKPGNENKPIAASSSAYQRSSEIDVSSVEAVALSKLVQWATEAETLQRKVQEVAEVYPEVMKRFSENDLRINSPCWMESDMAVGLHYVMERQIDLVQRMGDAR
jgi:hypothetical protein